MYQHAHHHIRLSVYFVLAVSIFISFLMWGVDLVYAKKVGLGIEVSGIELTGMTEKQAENAIEKALWKTTTKGVDLKYKDQNHNPSLDQIGVIFNSKKLAQKAINYDKGGNLFTRFWNTSKILVFGKNIQIKPDVDKAKLNAYLEYISKDTTKHAENANLTYSDENNSYFKVLDEQIGKIIDVDDITTKLNNEIEQKTDITNQNLSTIKLSTTEEKPAIFASDLTDIKNEANQLIASSFNFNFENDEYIADSSEIAKWLDFVEVNKEIKIELNEIAINTYLENIAKNIDIPVTDKIVEVAGSKRTVKREGKDGRQLNTSVAVKQINSALFENESRNISLQTSVVKPTERIVYPDSPPTGGLYPGRYIEINISAKQKMYLWNGDNLIATYTISSGKPGYYTPTGTYHVMNKNVRAWSSKYGLYMPYWMQFTGAGHGIHELPEWPGGYKEGLNHLGLRVSHGCVRLGVGPAAATYSFASIGTPIYIHY